MKIKSTKTTIEYAGRILIQPGWRFDGDAISDSLATTAGSVDLVGRYYAQIESHLNNKSTRNFSFVHDFKSVEDAVLFKLAAEEHAASNQTGQLTIQVDNTLRTYAAGLTQLDSDVTLTANSVRLVLRYSFITGETVS
jgi:hypothetical protein